MLRPDDHAAPRLQTPLPGPNARRMIAEDEKYTSPSYTRVYPLAVAEGHGAVIIDVDGNRFLDFTAGIAVCATGHCHPQVVAAIHEQSSKLIHMSGTDFYYGPQQQLARRLAELAPGDSPKRVFFTNSGAEAIEAAIKLARYHTGRQQIIAFRGAFHGRTLGALSLTASKAIQRRGFSPLIPGVTHIDYPNRFRSADAPDPIEQLENLFKREVPPEEVAAIFVEPILGEGGYIVPPLEFHGQLRAITQKHGILFVCDEVQTGIGRTGKMFAIEHWSVEPDIICLAKGIASGLPLGAMIARDELMTWPSGAHASTFGGNPVSCAAALVTLDLVEQQLMENAADRGRQLLERLAECARRNPVVGDVRGQGLMIGAELVRPGEPGQPPDTALQKAVIQRCFEKGLLLLGCGESTVRFCPPLVVDAQQVDTAAEIFEQALGELTSSRSTDSTA